MNYNKFKPLLDSGLFEVVQFSKKEKTCNHKARQEFLSHYQIYASKRDYLDKLLRHPETVPRESEKSQNVHGN